MIANVWCEKTNKEHVQENTLSLKDAQRLIATVSNFLSLVFLRNVVVQKPRRYVAPSGIDVLAILQNSLRRAILSCSLYEKFD